MFFFEFFFEEFWVFHFPKADFIFNKKQTICSDCSRWPTAPIILEQSALASVSASASAPAPAPTSLHTYIIWSYVFVGSMYFGFVSFSCENVGKREINIAARALYDLWVIRTTEFFKRSLIYIIMPAWCFNHTKWKAPKIAQDGSAAIHKMQPRAILILISFSKSISASLSLRSHSDYVSLHPYSFPKGDLGGFLIKSLPLSFYLLLCPYTNLYFFQFHCQFLVGFGTWYQQSSYPLKIEFIFICLKTQ